MLRALVFATIVLIPRAAPSQEPGRLLIKVALADAAGALTPVPRHALLVSAVPPDDVPRRLVTAVDGTATLRLLPGRYTVESDRPVSFQGKAYNWAQLVEVVAGRDVVLELRIDNAVVAAGIPPSTTPLAPDPDALLLPWQRSVVQLWTPTTRASGFVIDGRGLVATNQRVVGRATSVEVQLTPAVKVAGHVLVADAERDTAILRIDPAAITSLPSVPLPCAVPAPVPLALGDELVAIGLIRGGQADIVSGSVRRATSETILADFGTRQASTGDPVFTTSGRLLGITSIAGDIDRPERGEVRVVRIEDACDVVRAAQTMLSSQAPPAGTHLPVEPATPFAVDALRDAAARRAGSLRPYAMSSSDFDLAFITPVLAFAAMQAPGAGSMDFANWSDYVREMPPVLLVRVTPKQVESFWMTLVRGAAWTQGTSLPPIKHFRPGFSRLQAFCGKTEVIPIHPFKLELRVSETDAIYEGLSVFAPDALGPHCGTVRFVLFSEKSPDTGDARDVDPKLLRQVWQDFEPYRAAK